MDAAYRQLKIYNRLVNHQKVNKADLEFEFNVSARTIKRDLDSINVFLGELDIPQFIKYNHTRRSYELKTNATSITKYSILVLIKVLLASRSLTTHEMKVTTSELLALIDPSDRKEIEKISRNEHSFYQPFSHNKPLLQIIWELSEFITQKTVIDITYRHRYGNVSIETILPEALIFSEYYFYIVAYSADLHKNYYYRVDRIQSFQLSHQMVHHTQHTRFEVGMERKYLHYMQPGRKIKITFTYTGPFEVVKDRFPDAEDITDQYDQQFPEHTKVIQMTAYDQGAKMWLLSQGRQAGVLTPTTLKNAMRDEALQMLAHYSEH